jgi:hypothetical protein
VESKKLATIFVVGLVFVVGGCFLLVKAGLIKMGAY